MKTIWKFPLQVTTHQQIQVPRERSFLAARMQNGAPCLWFIVDPESPKVPLYIEIFGTGHAVPDGTRQFLGTVMSHMDTFVWHIFERL